MLKPSRLGGWSVSIPYDRRAETKTPGRGRAPESRDLFRAAQRDRESARAWRPARKLRIQSRARATTVRAAACASPAAAALEAVRRARAGHSARPGRGRVARHGRGPGYPGEG